MHAVTAMWADEG